MDLPIIVPTMLQQTIVYKVMHTHQFFTWTTHTAENTTLLDYKKLYTYVQHCNRTCNRILLVQYSIHIFNNSRLDVTHSVHHHFRIELYHGVRIVVKSREEFTVIKLTQHFKRLFERTLNIQTSSETICYDHSILEM